MDQPVSTCPQCGAAIKPLPGGASPARCASCGASLPRSDQAAWLRPPSARTPVASPAPAAAALLPPEYSRLPRPKPSSPRGGLGCLIIFGLGWTLFSIVFVIMGAGSYLNAQNRYHRLSQEGLTVPGVVTGLEIDDSGDSTSYYVSYQFTAAIEGDSTQVKARDSISSELYDRLEKGQAIDVLYAASDPNLSVVKPNFHPPDLILPVVFTGMGGLFVLIGLGIIYVGGKAVSELSELRSRGRQVQGIIFDRWQDKDSDGDPTYFVAYAFKVGAQQQIMTHAEQNTKLFHKCRIGDTVAVRYVPDRPTICQVWQ